MMDQTVKTATQKPGIMAQTPQAGGQNMTHFRSMRRHSRFGSIPLVVSRGKRNGRTNISVGEVSPIQSYQFRFSDCSNSRSRRRTKSINSFCVNLVGCRERNNTRRANTKRVQSQWASHLFDGQVLSNRRGGRTDDSYACRKSNRGTIDASKGLGTRREAETKNRNRKVWGLIPYVRNADNTNVDDQALSMGPFICKQRPGRNIKYFYETPKRDRCGSFYSRGIATHV